MNLVHLQQLQAEADKGYFFSTSQTLVLLSTQLAEVANYARQSTVWQDGGGRVDGSRFIEVPLALPDLPDRGYYDTQNKGYVTKGEAHAQTLLKHSARALQSLLRFLNQVEAVVEEEEEIVLHANENKDNYYLATQLAVGRFSSPLMLWAPPERALQELISACITYFLVLGISLDKLQETYITQNPQLERK